MAPRTEGVPHVSQEGGRTTRHHAARRVGDDARGPARPERATLGGEPEGRGREGGAPRARLARGGSGALRVVGGGTGRLAVGGRAARGERAQGDDGSKI